MGFKRVACLRDVPSDRGLEITLDGIEIGLYRIGDAYHAMDNLCPHAGYPLCDGSLEGSTIVCPGHGWEFDVITGLAPGEVDEPALARYPVRVEGEDLLVDVTAPLGCTGSTS